MAKPIAKRLEPGEKRPTSVRLTADGHRLLVAMASKLGVNQSAAMEIAIREKAKREGVE
jgi:hypothetical protein